MRDKTLDILRSYTLNVMSTQSSFDDTAASVALKRARGESQLSSAILAGGIVVMLSGAGFISQYGNDDIATKYSTVELPSYDLASQVDYEETLFERSLGMK